ncbi:hypothetical protein A3E04_00885 [Candidatus Kuenenbacteria bacterium RIFCSPHIGHO2_12_FULL_42_14]|uniref:Type 4 fimbrial biogenesis protein PilX N-terminal domain-containing protein n=1 Tax=Candidatus Kuenenbacteria bacterium RIFCSPHIGHO2_12_FULL_42_14 TaxID=1798563 RepID=A0A1F6GKV3_9BACT|nr:MAG: hypothetical protein A3E04_00885 [Candidatus Kuenenbacteria bacterium RIFCSPHIGHO2_12_FULL_42_14]
MLKNNILKNQSGGMLIMVLVFTTLFAVMATGIAGVISSQHKLGLKKINWQKAIATAEAGVNYYRWHLAHAPEDYQDGTGQAGPYVHDYKDNLGNSIGQFSLNITAPADTCSNAIIIESTGWLNDDPNVKRKVMVKYGKPSLASFAFLTDSNVLFGEDETLHGPVHSNGGIRMDGQNDSLTTSKKSTYICGLEHSCTQQNCNSLGYGCHWVAGDGCTCPGIWGVGGDQSLWQFPFDNINFDAITMELRDLRDLAQASMCSATEDCYWPQLGQGYHLVFKNDGTFDIYRVTQLKNPVWGHDGEAWVRDTDDIDRENLIGNYTIPASCGIIFVEDNLWVNGIVRGKATVVAAKIPEAGSKIKIRINGNLTYLEKSGANSLGLISQTDILIPLYGAPNNLAVDAALLAQKGRIFRKLYCYNCKKPVPYDARNYIIRDSIVIYGSIISNGIWTWTWVSGGAVISGYRDTSTIYDPNLNYNPPPGFPTTGDRKLLKWEETTEKP